MLRGFIGLVLAQLAGEAVALGLGLPVPGPVVGLVLLLGLLLARPSYGVTLEAATAPLLRRLSLLFLPAAVGVFTLTEELARDGVALVLGAALSTGLTLLLVGAVTQRVFSGSGEP